MDTVPGVHKESSAKRPSGGNGFIGVKSETNKREDKCTKTKIKAPL